MKKHSLCLFAWVFLMGALSCAHVMQAASDEAVSKKELKALKKEEKRLEKEAKKAAASESKAEKKMRDAKKKEQARIEKEEKKAAEAQAKEEKKMRDAQKKSAEAREKELKKAEKEKAKETKRLAKSEKKEKQEIKKDKSSKKEMKDKEAKRKEKEMREAQRRADREQRSQARKAEMRKDEEKIQQKLAKQERKKREHKEKNKLEHQMRLQEAEQTIKAVGIKHAAKTEDKKLNRQERSLLASRWQEKHAMETDREIEEGRYADLYKVPAWPTSNLFYEGDKNFVKATLFYNYATDAYVSSGGSSKHDISALEFGENQFTMRNISLAAKLESDGKAVTLNQSEFAKANTDLTDTLPTPAGNKIKAYTSTYTEAFNDLITYGGADKVLSFNGDEKRYGLSLDYVRYLMNRDIAFGVQLPIVSVHRRLDINTGATVVGSASSEGERIAQSDYLDLLFPTVFKKLLLAKGMTEMGGSETGIGDITLFGNVQINSKRFDKIVVGGKVKLPTAKGAKTSKLWAPALGNGGFAEFTAFASALVSYKRFLNPHLSLDATYLLTAHQDKRVPTRYTINKTSGVTDTSSFKDQFVKTGVLDKDFAFSDRIVPVPVSTDHFTMDEYDTTIRGFADNVKSVKIDPGMEFNLRLGNMFEKVLFRRAFLDVYYDLHLKAKDNVRGLAVSEWNTGLLEEHTSRVSHKLGAEWSYQIDQPTRMLIGGSYVFAGYNVPKAYDCWLSLNRVF